MRNKNPFVISGYSGAETFCDRQAETRRLIQLIDNGHNIVLSAPRRVGKTDLIKHVFDQPEVKDHYFTAIVDIYATRNLSEFVLFMSKAIYDGLKSKGKKMIDGFINLLQSLRAEITFDINGMPLWSLGIGKDFEPTVTLDEIFKYIEASPRPCLIAIDEFQQIGRYTNGSQVEALLRTYIQKCNNAQFVFAGSHQHMMTEMFVSPSRPFYQSATLFNLQLIPEQVYADFCIGLFGKYGKEIEPATISTVYQRFNGVTAYMQRLMNELFTLTAQHSVCRQQDVDTAIEIVLNEANDSYESIYYQLTERQRATMLAIAATGSVSNTTSSEFVKRYNLTSASSVRSSISTLTDKDLLTKYKDAYSISDHFFRLWLLRRFSD